MAEASNLYPIAIFEDRYGGAYSGGRWIAIADSDEPFEEEYWSESCRSELSSHSEGPWADDVTAMEFWNDPPHWIAVGETPDSALSNLLLKDHSSIVVEAARRSREEKRQRELAEAWARNKAEETTRGQAARAEEVRLLNEQRASFGLPPLE